MMASSGSRLLASQTNPNPARVVGRLRGLATALLAGAAVASAPGRDAVADNAAPASGRGGITRATEVRGDDELLLDQVFQSHLPYTLQAYALRLSVHPHLGDWKKKDRMRVTTSLRYGLTQNIEASLSSNLYFSHGHGGVRAFDDYGAASLQPGFKVNLGQPFFRGWDTGIGANYEFPVGHPAPELTDGLRHFRPYATFSHRLEAHPDVRIFAGVHGDIITRTALVGEFGKNAFHESSFGLTGGWVIDRGNLHYTLEAAVDTTRLFNRTGEDIYSLRPGIIWEIPALHHRQIVSNWMVGVALNDTFGPGGNSVGASFRLRYTSDLKSRFHRTPVVPSAP